MLSMHISVITRLLPPIYRMQSTKLTVVVETTVKYVAHAAPPNPFAAKGQKKLPIVAALLVILRGAPGFQTVPMLVRVRWHNATGGNLITATHDAVVV